MSKPYYWDCKVCEEQFSDVDEDCVWCNECSTGYCSKECAIEDGCVISDNNPQECVCKKCLKKEN